MMLSGGKDLADEVTIFNRGSSHGHVTLKRREFQAFVDWWLKEQPLREPQP
jgi:hypothetical protein